MFGSTPLKGAARTARQSRTCVRRIRFRGPYSEGVHSVAPRRRPVFARRHIASPVPLPNLSHAFGVSLIRRDVQRFVISLCLGGTIRLVRDELRYSPARPDFHLPA